VSPEPRLHAVFERRHLHKLPQDIGRVVRWIVVADATPALVAEAPPLLLEGRAAHALPVLDQLDQLILRQSCSLLRHQLLLLRHRLLVLHGLMVNLLLLGHGLEKELLLLVLDDLLPSLPEARQDLLLLVDAQPHRFALGKGYLHGAKFALLGDQYALLVEVPNGLLSPVEGAHANEGAADAALCL